MLWRSARFTIQIKDASVVKPEQKEVAEVVSDVVLAVSGATADTLGDIDVAIQRLQVAIAEMEDHVASLQIIRRAVAVKVYGKQARKPRSKSAKPGKSAGEKRDDDDREVMVRKIVALIDTEGSMPVPAIAARLNALPAYVGTVVNGTALFVTKGGEVHLAKGTRR